MELAVGDEAKERTKPRVMAMALSPAGPVVLSLALRNLRCSSAHRVAESGARGIIAPATR
jgi:hypothetical protein